MNAISSAIGRSQMIHQNYVTHMRAITQAENFTTDSANNVAETSAHPVGRDLKSSENINILLDSDTQTTMFALEHPDLEGAGRLNPEIAPLTNAYTQIERSTNDLHPSFDYLEVINNPHETMSQYEVSYNKFLEEGNNVIDQMKAMDNTGLLTFRFTINGPKVEVSDEDAGGVARNLGAIQQNIERIRDWIAGNEPKFDAIAEKGAAYAYANAAVDYKKTYGLTREDAINSGAAGIQKHALTMIRFATNHYGVNPMTESESTAKFGEAGVFTYASR